jgi:hypothetical protein
VELIRERLGRHAIRAETDRGESHSNVVPASLGCRVETTSPSPAFSSERRHQSRVRPGHAPHAAKPFSVLLAIRAQPGDCPVPGGEQQLRKRPDVTQGERQALAVDWIVVAPGVTEENDPVPIGLVAPRLLAAESCARPCCSDIAQTQRLRD